MVRLKVHAVLNLQTKHDMVHRGLKWEEIKQCYQANSIEVINFEIQDMNAEDFIKKGYRAAKHLKNLVNKHGVS